MPEQNMKDIVRCVVCGKDLPTIRPHVDTCSERCFRVLLQKQREGRKEMIERVVFRMGVIEVGPGYVRYFNRTASGGPYTLTSMQELYWRSWMKLAVHRFGGWRVPTESDKQFQVVRS